LHCIPNDAYARKRGQSHLEKEKFLAQRSEMCLVKVKERNEKTEKKKKQPTYFIVAGEKL